MVSATLSSKYQLAIPKAIREKPGLQAGQKFTLIAWGDVIELILRRSLDKVRGLFRGGKILRDIVIARIACNGLSGGQN